MKSSNKSLFDWIFGANNQIDCVNGCYQFPYTLTMAGRLDAICLINVPILRGVVTLAIFKQLKFNRLIFHRPFCFSNIKIPSSYHVRMLRHWKLSKQSAFDGTISFWVPVGCWIPTSIIHFLLLVFCSCFYLNAIDQLEHSFFHFHIPALNMIKPCIWIPNLTFDLSDSKAEMPTISNTKLKMKMKEKRQMQVKWCMKLYPPSTQHISKNV